VPKGPPGRLIVLCGLPGSGKTTTARRFEQSLGAVRLCPDEWMIDLGIDLWDEATRARVEALQWRLAQELLVLGQTVIIEWGVWARSERDVLRLRCRELGAAIELHHLDVPLDVLAERVAQRQTTEPSSTVAIERSHLEAWLAQFEAPDADELALFDPPLLA
jgi:predicted kinase